MAYRTIRLKQYTVIEGEAVANAALSPGHLIEVMSTGKVRKHASIGATCEKMFALEDELQGREIGDAYNTTTYDRVKYGIFRPGDEVYARILDGETLVIGDKLISSGDGTLRKQTGDSTGDTTETVAIAVAVAAVTVASSALLAVRIL